MLLPYIFCQSYKLLLQQLPPPSLFLLSKKITSGIDSEKFAKLLLEKEDLSKDCVLLAVEMYLQKPVQFHSGSFIGRNEGEDCAQRNGCVYDSVFKKVYSVCD